MNVDGLRKALKHRSKNRVGDFYIFSCTNDVLSGYALDRPPSSIYVWNFLLPTYDLNDFLHLSLGKRIFSGSANNVENTQIIDAIDRDWTALSKVQTAGDLLAWLEAGHFGGNYEKWATLVTLCRLGRLPEAKLLSEGLNDRSADNLQKRYSELTQLIKQDNEKAIRALLDNWTAHTRVSHCIGGLG